MQELSLNVLDVVQNSITAGASRILIEITEDLSANLLKIVIEDNGKGMSPETLRRVNEQFVSSRSTRKVGMGIALFRAAAELAGGSLVVESEEGRGTRGTARFEHDNIDRVPIGEMSETMVLLVMRAAEVDFIYRHCYNGGVYEFSTEQIKQILEDVPIDSYEVLQYIKQEIHEGLTELFGGVRDEIS